MMIQIENSNLNKIAFMFFFIFICPTLVVGQKPIKSAKLDIIRANAWLETVELLIKSGKLDQAIKDGTEAINTFENILGKNDIKLAKSYFLLAKSLAENSNYRESIPFFRKASNIYHLHTDYLVDLSNVYYDMALAYRYVNGDSLITYCNKSLAIRLEEFGENSLEVAEIYTLLGFIQMFRNNPHKCLPYYKKAVEIQSKFPDKTDILETYNYYGLYYFRTGDYDLSIFYYEKTIALHQKLFGSDYKELAADYNNLALIFKRTENFQKALDYFFEAVRIYKLYRNEDHQNFGAIYLNIGSCYLAFGQHEEALTYFQKSKKIKLKYLTIPNEQIGYIDAFIGRTYTIAKDLDKARYYYEQAEFQFSKSNKKISFLHASFFSGIGLLYEEMGDFERALENYEKSLLRLPFSLENPKNSFPVINDKSALIAFLFNISNLYSKIYKQTKDEAILLKELEIYNVFLQLIDYLKEDYEEVGSKYFLLQRTYPVFEKKIKVLFELYRIHGENDYLKEAFLTSEQSKDILLLDIIHKSRIESYVGVEDSIIANENLLKKAVTESEESIYFALEKNEDSLTLEELKSKLFELKKKLNEARAYIKSNYKDYHNLYEIPDFTIETIQFNLNTDNAIIEYFVGDENIYAFVITKDTFYAKSIPVDLQFINDLNKFTKSHYDFFVTDSTSSNTSFNEHKKVFNEYAYMFYKKLWKPLGSLPKNVIIIPDGRLAYLPFETLSTDVTDVNTLFDNYPFLIYEHSISYNFSVTLWQVMENESYEEKGLLAFAPYFEPCNENEKNKLCTLHFNEKESDAVCKTWSGVSVTNENATLENFIGMAPKNSILHLSTHAILNEGQIDYSYFAFTGANDISNKGKLFIKDLYNMRLPASMVVLSACETGIGESKKGEGVISLARGFSYAGAKSIITSLWKTNDRSTYEIMDRFYKYLKDGNSKSEALRLAKIDYIKNHNEEAHPFYWASFIPIGDMTKLESERNSKFYLILGIGVLIIFLGFIYMTRIK